MKGLNKLALVAAIAVASSAANAELKAIDDATMADVSGQSGLVIEAGFGGPLTRTVGAGADVAAGGSFADWGAGNANAGITIDAFKWQVDLETFDAATNTIDPTAVGLEGGFIAQNIAIAGQVDVTIDGAEDLSDPAAPVGGLYMTFADSSIDFKVGNMAFYQVGAVGGSMGGIEILGMNIDGLSLLIRGNGAPNAQ